MFYTLLFQRKKKRILNKDYRSLSTISVKTPIDEHNITFSYLREQIIGGDAVFQSPLLGGDRLITYADYTASGRSLQFIEDYIETAILPFYGNSHTEDSFTGAFMTRTLHEAEASIKEIVKAGTWGKIIACGNGATGAINKLQQLLGVFIPPATKDAYEKDLQLFLTSECNDFQNFQSEHSPIIFVGPFEHHSNEVSWRQGLGKVVEVDLSAEGNVDLAHLETLLQDPQYASRLKIGSFSAASNVTGVKTDVRAIAKLLHKYHAIACFDYAAAAPYVDIDMSDAQGEGTHLDAIFISPHKFIGGPGSAGILVFNEILYRKELPPTVAGGGTVAFVNNFEQDFLDDLEEREKAGTPNALAEIRVALAMQLKNVIGVSNIEEREQHYLKLAFDVWLKHPQIEVLGPTDPSKRLGIVSFNIRDAAGKWLHPKYVTTLLNDLFGIQSRGGCSCAGPFGHRILGIDVCESEKLRAHIKEGFNGLKLGWARVGFHFVHDEDEVNFIISAVSFIADHGSHFLKYYDFNVKTGAWKAKSQLGPATTTTSTTAFGIKQALVSKPVVLNNPNKKRAKLLYQQYLLEAKKMVESNEISVRKGRLGLVGRELSSAKEKDAIQFASAWFSIPKDLYL